jgi:hypothetical protein
MRARVGVVTAALVLSGCGGSDGPKPGALPYIPKLDDPVPVAADASHGSCPLGSGSQTVAGEVKNTDTVARDFVITVSWADKDLTLRGQGVAVVKDLAPGRTAQWRATGQVLDGATQCVSTVLRGELAP